MLYFHKVAIDKIELHVSNFACPVQSIDVWGQICLHQPGFKDCSANFKNQDFLINRSDMGELSILLSL